MSTTRSSRVTTSQGGSSESTTNHRFMQRKRNTGQPPAEGWVTVPVPDAAGGVQFRPRGFDDASASAGSTSWDVKSRYMMATRSGPTECPDHILARHKEFEQETKSFPSPYSLFYFDETAPNPILIHNDLGKKGSAACPDYQRVPATPEITGGGDKVSNQDAMTYGLRKFFFDVDDIRIPENGTGLKMLPSYSTSYKNYPAVCYDVVTPHHYNKFFRLRKRPGMFA